jgi:hypothetical protein
VTLATLPARHVAAETETGAEDAPARADHNWMLDLAGLAADRLCRYEIVWPTRGCVSLSVIRVSRSAIFLLP